MKLGASAQFFKSNFKNNTPHCSNPIAFKSSVLSESEIEDCPSHKIFMHVKSNNLAEVRQITLNPTYTKQFINSVDKNGKTPLDNTTEPAMKALLIAKGAKSSTELFQSQSLVEDARTVFMRNYVQNTGENKEESPSASPFLNAFEDNCEDVQNKPQENTQPPQEKIQSTEEKIQSTEAKPTMQLSDIVGLDEIKNDILTHVVMPIKELKLQSDLKKNNIGFLNGILLCGPNGNGKSPLAQAIAGEAKIPIKVLENPNDLGKMIAEIGLKFATLKKPTILLIKNIDKLVGSGNQSNNERAQAFERVLSNCSQKGVIVVATTTNSANVNELLLQPTILGKIYSFDLPNDIERAKFLSNYFNDKEILSEVHEQESIDKIMQVTSGFSTSQIKHVVDATIRTAAVKGLNEQKEEKVTIDGMLEEIKKYSKEQGIAEINEFNRTSMYDTKYKREKNYENEPKNLDEIGGMITVKEKVMEHIIEPFLNKEKLKENGVKMPDGVVLYGPPGTGKTFISKAIGHHLGLPVYVLKLSEIGTSLMHETPKAIREFVNQLTHKFEKTGEMSILLLDEIDSIGASRNGNHGASAKGDEVNALLQELNNPTEKGLIVIGATNNIEAVDPALIRDGRLGELIYTGLPDFEERKDLIVKFVSSKKMVAEYAKNEEFINKLTIDFNEMPPASIVKVLNLALKNMLIKESSFEDSIQAAFDKYQEKEVEKMLTERGLEKNRMMKVDKKSTIKYDTQYSRIQISDNEPQNFSELSGMSDVKDRLNKAVVKVWQPKIREMFRKNNMPIPGGVILYGPSANGKTTIAHALSGEMGVPIYELSVGSVGSSFIHQTSVNTKKMFDQLAYKYEKTGEASILFIDELEKFTNRRDSFAMQHSEHATEELTELLSLMNTASDKGIILVGATNFIDQIDTAIKNNKRRMGTQILVAPPDEPARFDIIKKQFEEREIANGVNNNESIKTLSDFFEGKNIGDIVDAIQRTLIDSIMAQEEVTIDQIKLNTAQRKNG